MENIQQHKTKKVWTKISTHVINYKNSQLDFHCHIKNIHDNIAQYSTNKVIWSRHWKW